MVSRVLWSYPGNVFAWKPNPCKLSSQQEGRGMGWGEGEKMARGTRAREGEAGERKEGGSVSVGGGHVSDEEWRRERGEDNRLERHIQKETIKWR
jgi:hypothetical protein